MLDEAIRKAVGERLWNARQIRILSHMRPDGDAIGSMLGLGLCLTAAGKTVQMVLTDGVPYTFRHLQGADLITKKPGEKVDLVVSLDCSDLGRLGDVLNDSGVPEINIDHHITNTNFGALNLVDPEAVATAALLTECLPDWGFTISQEAAAALMNGLVSDSLGFRTSNMNSKALRLAANLMEAGANLPEIYNQALLRRSYTAARYWGAGLLRMQREDRIVWTSLTLEDRQTVEYNGNDDADLINILSTIDDFDIALIFIEQRGGKVKVSWRSSPGVDVSQLAVSFGGGGHPAAAGAEITGTMEEVQQQVLTATRSALATGTIPENQG
ncbi:MAG: DHH family phosphoesterase [Anaerolineaceae bacterium]